MRRSFAIILTLCMAALLMACGTQNEGTASSGTSSAPSSTAETDFTNTNFSGHWAVSEVFDSAGESVSAERLTELGSFTLELLTDGTYFVYNAAGSVLGQGHYTVEKDQMILAAGGEQTLYIVADQDTLRGAAADGSVTVLTRQPEPTPAMDEEELSDDTDEDEDITTSPGETEEDVDIPDDDTDVPDEASAVVTDAA